MANSRRLSALTRFIIRTLVPGALSEEVEGDLEERFVEVERSEGRRAASVGSGGCCSPFARGHYADVGADSVPALPSWRLRAKPGRRPRAIVASLRAKIGPRGFARDTAEYLSPVRRRELHIVELRGPDHLPGRLDHIALHHRVVAL